SVTRIGRKAIGKIHLLFFNFENYPQVKNEYGKEKARQVILGALRVCKNNIGFGDLAMSGKENEIIVLAHVTKKDAPKLGTRLKGAVKKTIFEIKKEEVNFSV
ncbi:unnamed protein product, partial [marine sediment metagenome]